MSVRRGIAAAKCISGSQADISLPADAAASETGVDIWPPLRSAGTGHSSPMSPLGGCAVGQAAVREKSAAPKGSTGLESRALAPWLFLPRR
jgi:hypothetical protein